MHVMAMRGNGDDWQIASLRDRQITSVTTALCTPAANCAVRASGNDDGSGEAVRRGVRAMLGMPHGM